MLLIYWNSLHQNINCNHAFLSWGLVSLVLVLIFVVYSRRREAHIKYPGPDDDVRENIINYDDEGGGEDDMTAFDITPLQIPIGGPMPEMGNCKLPIMCKYLTIFNNPIKEFIESASGILLMHLMNVKLQKTVFRYWFIENVNWV